MANILSTVLQQLQPSLRSNGFGVANSHRRIALFIPPSTKSPLFVYGNLPDQRSFLSLGTEDYDPIPEDEDIDDVLSGELSRTVSLPSQISEVPHEPELDWLLEEHQRMYSSMENSDISDDEGGLIQNYHGYEDDTDDYQHFMSRIRHNQSNQSGQKRKRSFRSIGSLSLTADEDFQSEKVTTSLEIRKLVQYSIPLVITFCLEHVFSVVCVLVVSHLGKNELGAVSLATMTSNIIFAIFDGLSTALDTLCPQAYGAGDYHAVGIHFQRCSLLAMALFIPFGTIWWFSDIILAAFVPDTEIVRLTCLFLRIMLPGAPAYIIFENLKRYMQAQGIFEAGTYVLLICSPLNVIISYLLVWNKHIGLGFIGAPIAITINFWMMLLLLTGYAIFIDGLKCWGGLSKMSLNHWGELMKLAIPGIVMLEAESLSYEILTLFASGFGSSYLATQSAVSTIASLFYMIPFSIGIAASTRIANFIGAERINCAKLASKIGIYGALCTGFFDSLIILAFKKPLTNLFSKDEEVFTMIIELLPLIACAQVFDSMNAVAGSCLRGQGMQRIGSYINLFVYYVIGIPLAWFFSYYLDLKLAGLWIGMTTAFVLIGGSESWFVLNANWDLILEEARDRKENDFEERLL